MRCEIDECGDMAFVRVERDIIVRTPDGNIIDDWNERGFNYTGIREEKYVCPYHAMELLEDDFTIVEWRYKIPSEILFGFVIKPIDRIMDWLKSNGIDELSYHDISIIRHLRWNDYLYCPICGNRLIHEERGYYQDSGYDTFPRWLNIYKIVRCSSCDFFDWDPFRIGSASYKHDDDFSGFKNPSNDPDYHKWLEYKKSLSNSEAIDNN